MPTKIIIFLSRIIFAAVLIFSGFVKAVDPLGSAYKFQDFFAAFGVEWLFPAALPLAIFLSTLEFAVGFAFLFCLNMRLFAPIGLILMAVFTPATVYIALTNPVPHCGCFGDAIVISNHATASKNLALLIASVIVFFNRDRLRSPWSHKTDGLLIFSAISLIVAISFYGLRYLPIIDFRPWKVGNNIAEMIEAPPSSSGRIYLVFENRSTGETRQYPADNYPWDDPEWNELWKYKARKENNLQSAFDSPLGNFRIVDESGRDITGSILSDPGYLYLVVAYDLNTTNRRAFDTKITPLAEKIEKDGHSLVVLTAAISNDIKAFKNRHNAGYPFYQSDERELKTIVRANPGLVLMKNGIVIAKWAHLEIPGYAEIRKRHKR